MSDRVPCVIPFCRRTGNKAKLEPWVTQICCWKHWRQAPKWKRRAYSKLLRKKNAGAITDKEARIAWLLWNSITLQIMRNAL